MHEVQLGDTVLMECQRCHGTWLDTQTFERICAGGEAQAAVLQQYAAPPQARTMPEVRYRPCLACGKMMNRLNFGKVSGTIVDVCKGHGTFLDAGELHRIATFIRGGGLERARQRQIDELKAEEARLRALQMQRPQGHAHSDFEMPVGSWSAPDLSMLLDWLKRS
jgi:Zn-finger nucleic acid-binding protein